MSVDKREHTRFPVEVTGEIEFRGELLSVSTQNLSRGGVALVLEPSLPEGSAVRMSLFLTQDGIEDPDEEPFDAEGVARWVAENDAGLHVVGVQFGPLSDAQKAQLERFLCALEG